MITMALWQSETVLSMQSFLNAEMRKKLKWKSFQRSSFMGMNDFRREDEMQKRLDEREQMEEEEEEEMKEENMDTKEEEETVINNHNDNNNSNHTDEKVR